MKRSNAIITRNERKYIYRLIGKVSSDLDLRPYTNEIAAVIKAYGGYDIRVYKRSYSFKMSSGVVLTNSMKRRIGRAIAKIEGIGCYAIPQYYTRKNGKSARATHLFLRSKKAGFQPQMI